MKPNLTLIAALFFHAAAHPEVCVDVPFYKDSEGDGCSWYANSPHDDDNYQNTYGHLFKEGKLDRCDVWGACCADSNGLTANKACCVCGGGTLAEGCKDWSDWRDFEGDDCAWYSEPVGPPHDDQYEEWDSRCYLYGLAYGNLDGHTASEACCACGGGYRDVESSHPSAYPTRAPTQKPGKKKAKSKKQNRV